MNPGTVPAMVNAVLARAAVDSSFRRQFPGIRSGVGKGRGCSAGIDIRTGVVTTFDLMSTFGSTPARPVTPASV
ncbi:MAG TPA: hypothetical protein VLR26_04435 [Frankiaceae bacterium]|nr:hypothetical protein [Frankiaceae bacterium]